LKKELREFLLKELEYARQVSNNLPLWKKLALENARKIEIKLGYIEETPSSPVKTHSNLD